MTPEERIAQRPHIPERIIDSMTSSTSFEILTDPDLWSVKKHDELFHDISRLHGGFILPPFQRPPVWDRARQIAFVEAAYLGFNLGTIVWNDASDVFKGGKFHHTDRWLIDGQQRIAALLAYVANEFAVFAGTPHEHRWSDLNIVERRYFGHIQIGYSKLTTTNEAKLRAAYNALNFAGVPHTPDQAA